MLVWSRRLEVYMLFRGHPSLVIGQCCQAKTQPKQGVAGWAAALVSSPTPNLTIKLLPCFSQKKREGRGSVNRLQVKSRDSYSQGGHYIKFKSKSAGRCSVLGPANHAPCLTSMPGLDRTQFHATSRRRQFHLRPRCPRPPLRDNLPKAQAAIAAEQPPTCTMRSASTPASPAPSARARPRTRRRPPLPAPTPKLR